MHATQIRQCTAVTASNTIQSKTAKYGSRTLNLIRSNKDSDQVLARIPAQNESALKAGHMHLLLNHSNMRTINKTLKQAGVPVKLGNNDALNCSACAQAKTQPAPHRAKAHDYAPGHTLTSDVKGPFSFPDGDDTERYFVTCVDIGSRYAIAIQISTRSEVVDTLTKCIDTFHALSGVQASTLHTDNAAEYMSKRMQVMLAERGISHETSTPYLPQENGMELLRE